MRYSRHVLIPEIGVAGQQRLLAAKRARRRRGRARLAGRALPGGRRASGGSGIVDDDVVDESNLQRQVLHSTAALGEPKVASAERRLRELNPDVEVVAYRERLTRGQRRPHPRRGLGGDRRRRRQLPDALPAERRLGLARHPRRPRLDLPLRGPGDRLRAGRGPLLPLPVPAAASAGAGAELRRGRRAGSAARA